jgi:peptidoglycan/LPS O-acetylase OafA/YrhL
MIRQGEDRDDLPAQPAIPAAAIRTNTSYAPEVNRIYFPGLNALRAYAAFAVIFSHIDQNVSPRPLFAIPFKYLFIDSSSAVSLFFVLSGFLITYLLLREAATTGKVAVVKFYVRRALRIWPLYYTIAILGLLIFPFLFGPKYVLNVFYPDYPATTMPLTAKLMLAFFLLPNFASISAPMEHLWSIGVEEQFYAVWPWVFRNKLNLVRVCLGVIIIKFMLAPVLPMFNSHGMIRIFDELRFECMAIGALGAYIYTQGSAWLKWAYHPAAQLLALGACVLMAGRIVPVNAYATSGIAVAFIVLMLNVATNPRSLIKLDHPILERLGQVSYGLYLYHFPVLFLFLTLTPRFSLFNDIPFYPPAVFIGAIAGTWLIAELSYRRFEKPFLDLKERFAIVHSKATQIS